MAPTDRSERLNVLAKAGYLGPACPAPDGQHVIGSGDRERPGHPCAPQAKVPRQPVIDEDAAASHYIVVDGESNTEDFPGRVDHHRLRLSGFGLLYRLGTAGDQV